VSYVNKEDIYFHELFIDVSSNLDYVASNEWTTVYNEMERTWKDFSLKSEATQENHEEPQSGISVSRSRVETDKREASPITRALCYSTHAQIECSRHVLRTFLVSKNQRATETII
jgi:hypothetical protein